ncbi:uncharacterized protein LOC111023128 [Momordica charantia]|uniref:Uncharacterized protein LOC111023128 n=1 Tax=Momordica charantia TaxID=3673 RepID=A0A6J1DPJ9_MOMCH|nr:uncharacterized protein LOC111023128 [Momordica charantia]
MLEKPSKTKSSPDKRNKSKYYRFHRDHGHDTSKCFDLRDQIENLIRHGHLKKYVGKKDSCSSQGKRKFDRTNHDDQDKSPSLKKIEAARKRPVVINTIFGGPSGGQSGNKRKALIRETSHEVNTSYVRSTVAISFSADDLEGVHLPHNDALVISPIIDNMQVQPVLIDGRASTNILSLSTYLALGWEKSQLKRCPTPLVGFSGEMIAAEGCTDLPVTIGENDNKVRKVIEFVMVDGASAYNAILGRPYIHELQVVPSTYHQVMKYPTPCGVEIIKGEQKASRECYATALKGTRTYAVIIGTTSSEVTPGDKLNNELGWGTSKQELKQIKLGSDEKVVSIGSGLKAQIR